MKTLLTASFMILLPAFAFASFDQNLSYGMSGNDVYQVQDILIDRGCLSHEATGYFGLLTLNAVKCFQRNNGLPITGYVGAMTRGVLNDIIAVSVDSSSEAQSSEAVSTSSIVTQPNVQPVVTTTNTMTNDAIVGSVPSASITVTPHRRSDGITFYSVDITGNYDHFSLSGESTYANGNKNPVGPFEGKSPVNTQKGDQYQPYEFVLAGELNQTMDYNLTLSLSGEVVATKIGTVTFSAFDN